MRQLYTGVLLSLKFVDNFDTRLSKAFTEARARIIWGESEEEVLLLLNEAGLEAGEAATLVRGWFAERDAEARELSRKRMIHGSLLAGAVLLFFTVLPWQAILEPLKDLRFGRRSSRDSGFYPAAIAVIATLGIYGAWKAYTGVIGWVVPRSVKMTPDL